MENPIPQSNAGGFDTSRFDDAQENLTKAYENLSSALTSRTQQDKNRDMLLAISQGLLTPGPTGHFGESLGNVAGNLMKVQRSQDADAIENAKMRLEMAKAKRGLAQEQTVAQAVPNIYKQTDAGMEVDPAALQALARVTGDPKYMDMLYQHDKAKRLREASKSVFTPVVTKDENGQEKTSYQLNQNALFTVAMASQDPMKALAEQAEMVPKLRKAGMLKDLSGDISTPFDAIALMAPSLGSAGPAYAEQAKRLAKQYQTGMIDDDKANQLANQMMQTLTASMDRQSQLQNTQVMQQFQRMMAMQNFNQDQQRLEDKRKDLESKLTDEQKATYNKIIIPIVNEGIKGNSALLQLERLKNIIEKSPSGALSGYTAATIGSLFGTDDNTALRELQALSKGLVPLVPRLPGSASNLDSNNIEGSLGKLADPKLTIGQRREIVKEIYNGFKSLTDRAETVQNYWDANKKFDPKILNPEPEKPSAPKPGAPAAPGNQPAAGAPTLRWNPATKQFE
jgi:hypothetical protein